MKLQLISLMLATLLISAATAQALTINRILPASMTKSGGWSTASYTGSRTGTVITTGSAGQTVTFTSSDSDLFLIAPPAETYDARLQVAVDGTNTKIINLKGVQNHNPGGMAQETITIRPIALGLTGTHTVTLTTMDAVTYKVDCVESKTGTIALDNSSILGMGDSITYQGGLTLAGGYVFDGFVSQLCAYYGKNKVDFSEGSATLDQIAMNYWNNASGFSTHPYMMTLMGGVNDYFDGITDTSLIYRVGEIIDIVRSINPDVEIRLGNITYMSTTTYPGGNVISAPMNAAIHDIAQTKQVKFADTNSSYSSNSYVDWAGSGSPSSGGGVHPNGAGHTLLFQKFRDATAIPLSASIAQFNSTMSASFR